MALSITVSVVLALAICLWVRANRLSKHVFGRSTTADVQAALEVLFDSKSSMDEFELFLARPIDDPYLEFVRLRCKAIYEQHDAQPNQYVTDEGIRMLAAVLDEVKEHAARQRATFNV